MEHNFSSIIDLDVYLFGLIYYTVFQNKKLNLDQKTLLKDKINGRIKSFKEDYYHKKTPSALVHIKERVDGSISIYRGFLDEQA